jgi:pimeloyl-ACP methyl ester carboxylesterase
MFRTFRPLVSLLLPLVLLICLPGEARSQEKVHKLEAQQDAGVQFRESTKRILHDHDLKRQAHQAPGEAIVALDRLRAAGTESAEEIAIAITEVALDGAHQQPDQIRLGLYLSAAAETFSEALEQAAARGPSQISDGGTLSARGLNVRAVEGLIDALQDTHSEVLEGRTVSIPGPLAEYQFRWVSQIDLWTPATHEYVGASTVKRKKKDVAGLRSGLGAPIVAVRKGDLPDKPVIEGGVFPMYEYYYPLTAVLDLAPADPGAPRSATLNLVDPRRNERFEVGGVDYPLAIDLGAQFLVLEQETNVSFDKGGTLRSGKHMSEIGLYAPAPLRTDKIPVVMVHGLLAGPTGWYDAFDSLSLDPELRQSYQGWAFAYPTGLPFPYAARFLREALVETIERLDPEGTNPLLQQVVIVAHSLGGLLTRLMISDSGLVMWNSAFSESPDEIDLEPEDLEWVKASVIFESLPFITRAVFFSTPHRGSKYAANSVGKLGASFVPLPDDLQVMGKRILLSAGDSIVGDGAERGKLPDGIQTLQPESNLILALDQIEIDPRVTYHSIIGDRGKGDTPESSDGIVAYWSSHLEGAASETIVPSGHGTYKDPQGIAELQRILHEHLDSRSGGV